jgi:HlyD family secretion protein
LDRPLDPQIRTRRLLKRGAIAAVTLAAAVALFMGAIALISPSVSRSSIRTARVEAGSLDATITASGTVVPEVEQALSSPVDARVLRVLKRAGAVLEKGDPILDLDLSESKLAVDRLDQQVALKVNEQARRRLDLEATLGALAGQIEIKKLEMANLNALADRDRKLFTDGLVSAETRRQSELNASRAEVELAQLRASEEIARRSTAMQVEGLDLELTTLRKEEQEARRQLELATTKSDRKGVLTYVVSEEGATVRKGEILARVADLSAFRVDATVSDVHAGRLTAGMPAQIETPGGALPGRVSRVSPAVDNGVMTLSITLDEPSNAALRANQRVDVLLVTDRKERTLKLKKGPFAMGDGATAAFVVRGDAAYKTPIRLGVASFEAFEVLDGLTEGDEVIISDTSNLQHLTRVRIR